MSTDARKWLDNRHEIHAAFNDHWKRMERLLEGGPDAIRSELLRWESDDDAFEARARTAVYENAMRDTAAEFVGHIAASYPDPDSGGISFGSLGTVKRPAGKLHPDPAELVWHNADGGTIAATPWTEWWSTALVRALVLGHRWILVEGAHLPGGRQPTQADELAGLHPYLVDYSPTVVTDWHIDGGHLQYVVIRRQVRRPQVKDGVLIGLQPETEYYVHVRRGWTAFDEAAPGKDGIACRFSAGGWWKFDKEKKIVRHPDGTPATGSYDWNNGEIPMFVLYGEQSSGTTERPALSRLSLYEVGQAQVALMNVISARQADALEAAKSMIYLLGVDQDGFNLAMTKIAENARFIPVSATKRPDLTDGHIPQIYDGSTGTVAAQVWDGLYRTIVEMLRSMTLKLAMTAPDASGAARELEFGKQYSPRLALLAANLEAAQNTAIHLLEKRWGRARGTPMGQVTLPRRFQLKPLVDAIDRMFDTLAKSGLRSATLSKHMVLRAAAEHSVLANDAAREIVEHELEASAQEAERNRAALAGLNADFQAALERARQRRPEGQPPRASDPPVAEDDRAAA